MSSQYRFSNGTNVEEIRGGTRRRRRAWIAVLILFVLASCERAPSKSDYVSARVTEMCGGETSEEIQPCRLAVIAQFSNVSLEEMQRRYPAPEPRPRPSCAF